MAKSDYIKLPIYSVMEIIEGESGKEISTLSAMGLREAAIQTFGDRFVIFGKLATNRPFADKGQPYQVVVKK